MHLTLKVTVTNIFVTNIICDLIGSEYALRNCTDANNIFGKFNSLIEYKKLVVLNEAKDANILGIKYQTEV